MDYHTVIKYKEINYARKAFQKIEHLSDNLSGIWRSALNAIYHEKEAKIVKDAGEQGKITIATNMAGRGTDIKLGRKLADLGGLHVIATERHESGRIDRQLFGRSARQGDPGSGQAYMSVDDELIRRFIPKVIRKNLAWAIEKNSIPLKIFYDSFTA